MTEQRQSAELAECRVEICALYALSRKLSLSYEGDDIPRQLEDIIRTSFEVDNFSLMFIGDGDSEALPVWYSSGSGGKCVSASVTRLGNVISRTAIESGKPVLVASIEKEKRFDGGPGASNGKGSLFSTPLIVSGKLIGVFSVYMRKPEAFDIHNVNLYNAAAWHIARAVENSKLLQSAKEMAMIDELTCIYSRRFFLENFKKELSAAKRSGLPLSLIMFDIDNFKKINDEYGHPMGDVVLRTFGKILKSNTRKGDIAARYGGEEFVVLLPRMGLKDATAIAEKLRMAVENELTVDLEGKSVLRVTVSGGVASHPEFGETSDELILNADKSLLEAKKNGKNMICSMPDYRTELSSDDRRVSPRFQLRIVLNGIPKGIKLIELMVDNEWLSCELKDISSGGFKGYVPFEPTDKQDYSAKVGLLHDPANGPEFSIKCIRKEYTRDGFMMCAKVTNNLNHWNKAINLITR
ncbi:MAG TPA: GGDEF domain-containing protein [Nitrospirae bacterium]|nr:GGDEF domain-containing protein [Nitrospirota bacterium]